MSKPITSNQKAVYNSGHAVVLEESSKPVAVVVAVVVAPVVAAAVVAAVAVVIDRREGNDELWM